MQRHNKASGQAQHGLRHISDNDPSTLVLQAQGLSIHAQSNGTHRVTPDHGTQLSDALGVHLVAAPAGVMGRAPQGIPCVSTDMDAVVGAGGFQASGAVHSVLRRKKGVGVMGGWEGGSKCKQGFVGGRAP